MLKVRCACGNVLDARNVRSSGMAVCRCGNNVAASDFEERTPARPKFESIWRDAILTTDQEAANYASTQDRG